MWQRTINYLLKPAYLDTYIAIIIIEFLKWKIYSPTRKNLILKLCCFFFVQVATLRIKKSLAISMTRTRAIYLAMNLPSHIPKRCIHILYKNKKNINFGCTKAIIRIRNTKISVQEF